MMAALDGELRPDERDELDRLLAEDGRLRDEWARMSKVKEVTNTMGYTKPPEEVWDRYWVSVFNQLERGLAWILVSIGAVVLLGYGTWEWIDAVLGDSDIPGFVKLAIFAVALGGLVLLVSVIREKWFTRRRDPYKEVER
jgi:hypothetical protein